MELEFESNYFAVHITSPCKCDIVCEQLKMLSLIEAELKTYKINYFAKAYNTLLLVRRTI